MAGIRDHEMALSPKEAYGADSLARLVESKLKLEPEGKVRILKRSIDARGKTVKVRVKFEILDKESSTRTSASIEYPNVASKPPVIVIGAGPAGLFAALKVIERGFKPIILERGKDVQSRRRDIAAINKAHLVCTSLSLCQYCRFHVH